MTVTGLREAVAQTAPVQWNGIARVVAFADVHGAYTELRGLLHETGIIDAQDRWSAGRTHVASLGDLLDRGADSRKVMDLLMRLQVEAAASGGHLHVVLGNHEAMNILGDLRDVSTSEYAAYIDMESASERTQQRQAWEAAQVAETDPAFDKEFPPGYFGHRAALSPTGKYGQWLLAQPVAIVLNDTLFMHAGPSSALRGMSLQALNRAYRAALGDYLALAAQLGQAKLLLPTDEFSARPQLANDRLSAMARANGGVADPTLTDATTRFAAAASNTLLSDVGPNWYRGQALCNEATETDVLVPLLQQFDVTRLVAGHTPTRNSRATTRFDGRVVKLDTGMNGAVYKGRATALLVEPAGLTVRYAGEVSATPLLAEGLFVAPNEIDDASVLAALSDGAITVTGQRGPNELMVSVSHDGKRIPAVFQVRERNAARKEVAAYRLDRLLKLGIVPVTVEREVQDQRGVLQGRPLNWVTQAEVQQQGLRGGGWCSVEPQFQLIYAFDALSGNESRNAESMVYDSTDWLVYSTAHQHAFGTTSGLPAYLKERPPAPGTEVRRRISALDEDSLQAALENLIDARARKAILRRRDALLALPAAVPGR